MRVDIVAIGSQGDVQPAVAFGLGLKRAGHGVRVVTKGGYERFVRERGLDHLAIVATSHDALDTDVVRDWVENRTGALGFVRGFVRLAASQIRTGTALYWAACGDVEALVVNQMGLGVGLHIAERLKVPLIRWSVAPTRHDGSGRGRPIQTLRKDLTAAVFRQLLWSQLRRVTNEARAGVLALPPLPFAEPYGALNRRRSPVLDEYSRAVVPSPPGCDGWIRVTGYWFLDEPSGWTPPDGLVDFLASGPPPTIVGFGSTPFPDPEAATDMIAQALRRNRQRGVLLTGGSGLATGRLNDDLLSVDFVPHNWLFPRGCAVVHHGGAGVTGAALRAGLPSVVVPIFADQPFWGERVFELGVGPRPIPAKRLSLDTLAAALAEVVKDNGMRRRASDIGAKIRAEDGIARAVESFEQYVDRRG
jgi:UDP:flavonoid glycosyltransferase YjiC (YdhE family)